MIKQILKITFLMMIAVSLGSGMSGCKSKKKLAREQAAAEYARKVETAKQDLLSIINDDNMSLNDKKSKLQRVKDMNLNEPEILALIREAEQVIEAEEEEMRLKWEEENKKKNEAMSLSLADYFALVAGASSIENANKKINEALNLFESPDTPVLIIISQDGDLKDYDRPTTAQKYLEYLKDQKKNLNEIGNIEYNDNGKIKLLELIKKDY